MGDVKTLVQEIFSWLKLQEESAKKLENLANEMEERQKAINVTKVVGSSVSVGGAAALTVAGITFLTGGAAIPFIGAAATVASVAGLATNVTSDIVGAVKSKNTMEEAEEITKKMEDLKKKIQELVKSLREEWLKKEKQEPGTSPEDYVIREIVKEIARLNGFKMDDDLYKKMSRKKPGDNLLNRIDFPMLSNFILTIAVEIADEELRAAKIAAADLAAKAIEKGAEEATTRYVMKEAAKVATTAAVAKTAAEEAAKAATKAGLEGSVKVITAKVTGGEAAKLIIAKATAEEAAKVVAARAAAKQAAEQAAKAAAAKAAAKATAKAAGRALGGAIGLVFTVPELIGNCKDLDKCDTKASKFLRENASAIQTTAKQLRGELDEMQKMFGGLAAV
ncbi:treponemal membrane protein B-like [Mugil cephalus]|uniref:treponemal membrane protein B-like n=1 Tax=Mugil cephalus TaxID=48193 RepID=UPI001FB7366A|nr:treponemal membrane protein B-like [Mugil cephalus]XP_047436970.1 treponemal membrane protein B-like [Mugil cephalus]